MTPRLIATDVDGTLLRPDETVSARTGRALAAVARSGTPLALVTGRPPRWLRPVLAETAHRGPVVCANGAMLYDVPTQRVLRSYPMEVECLRAVAENIRRILPDAAFAAEYGDAFVHEPGYRPRWDVDLPEVSIVDLTVVLARPAVKLLVRHAELDADAMFALVRPAVGDLAVVTHGSGDARMEISALGVTKATALAALAEELGIDRSEVIAFGDMPNDLPMMEWAGRSYAVENAHPDVRAIADEVVGSNSEDGVAGVLERWWPVGPPRPAVSAPRPRSAAAAAPTRRD
ncbi:HAD family hydrolase [Micromonospora sp. NPDC003816]|uniref:HAD family hydrolase n=1 Tax=Micromonospora sp. NPDC003816 TaxID=3364224 RepID=UPI00368AA280